jgi:hypothetical protein
MRVAVALVQEPYVGARGEVKPYPGARVIQCTLNRSKPVKAAIIGFDDQLRITHDPQLVTETEVAIILEAGTLRVGLVSLYYAGDKEIEPYLERTKAACKKLGTNHTLIGGDTNAWSHWWGSECENERGQALNSFLNEMDFHILNKGDTPTFEEYRRGKLCTSIVDVTACSSNLLDKIGDWRVDRSLITSDHNAIRFTLEVGVGKRTAKKATTRIYNTKKAVWSDFDEAFGLGLQEEGITADTISSVSNGREMEEIVRKYTIAITKACEKSIPQIGKRRRKATPPWWTEALQQQKCEVLRRKRRIRKGEFCRHPNTMRWWYTRIEAKTSISCYRIPRPLAPH